MKFLNRKDKEVELSLRSNTQQNEPILAQSGAGQAISLEQCSSEERKAILSNVKE